MWTLVKAHPLAQCSQAVWSAKRRLEETPHVDCSAHHPQLAGVPAARRDYAPDAQRSYVTAVIVLYLLTAIMGGYIYTNYRIAARFTLEQGHFWKTFGAFELKEHFIAIGLGVLPAYWYFWRSPDAAAFARTRTMLTTILAFVVWWGFLVGHLTNNVRGLGT
jgi:hypothetical protein